MHKREVVIDYHFCSVEVKNQRDSPHHDLGEHSETGSRAGPKRIFGQKGGCLPFKCLPRLNRASVK